MKITKRKKLLKAAGLLLCFVLIFAALGVGAASYAADGPKGGNPFLAKYEFGSEVLIPVRNLEINGTKHKAKAVILCPDGTAVAQDKVKLSKHGKYTVDYRVRLDGKNYSEKFSFEVPYAAWTLKGKSDFAKYEERDGVRGLYVTMSNGGSILFNHAVKREMLTKDNELFSFYIRPSKMPQKDANGNEDRATIENDCRDLYLDILDGDNPDNYLSIKMNTSPDYWAWDGINPDVTYIKAKTSGQSTFYGYAQGYMDRKEDIGSGNYGFAANGGFFGLHYGDKAFNTAVSYDDAEMTVYSPSNCYTDHSNVVFNVNEPLKNADSLWDGFKSDFVKLRIRPDVLEKSSMTVAITGLLGAELNKKYLDLDKAGDVKIMSDYEGGEYPPAVVGKPYRIFDAESQQMYTKENIVINVYTAYDTEARRSVSVENGFFVPKKPGIYTIEYKAVDGYGNENVKTISVEAKGSVPPIDFKVGVQPSELGIGNFFTPAEITDAKGGTGKLVPKIYYRKKGSTEAEELDGEIRLLNGGMHEVVYEVTDYIGNKKTVIRELDVTPSDKPVIIGEPVLPAYIINGATYEFPSLSAEDFSSGTRQVIECTCKIFESIQDANPKSVKYSGVYTAGPDCTKVKVLYTAKDGNGKISSKSYDIQAVNVGYPGAIDMSAYFLATGGSSEVTPEGLFLKGQAGSEFTCIRELIGDFEAEFNLTGASTAKGVSILLTDTTDPGNQVKLNFLKDGKKTRLIINDSIKLQISQTLGGEVNYSLALEGRALSVQELHTSVMKNMAGKKFEGFKKVYAKFSFIESSGQSELYLKHINRQTLSSKHKDSMEPRMVLSGLEKKSGELHDTIDVVSAFCIDVLDPHTKCLVTVTGPDKNPYKDVNGLVLDKVPAGKNYSIQLEYFGKYMVRYDYEDSRGNRGKYLYAIRCVDKIPPEIAFAQKSYKGTVKKRLELPEFEATDNLTPADEMEYWYVITEPSGKMVSYDAGKGYIFEKPGTYTVYVMVIDECDNMTYAGVEYIVR